MTPQEFLSNFGHISDAPGGVDQLRGFVLQMAVQGLLSSQRASDGRAQELLATISANREEMETAGRRRRSRPASEVCPSEYAYQIPRSWSWTRLATIGLINPRNDAIDATEVSFFPMAAISERYGAAPINEIRSWGEVKKGFTHIAEGDVVLAKITPCFQNRKSVVMRNLTNGLGAGTTELHVFRPIGRTVLPEYVLLFLKSPHFLSEGVKCMTGSAGQKRVPKDYFSKTPFPLPPRGEQDRIVAKVNELMRLCDELEERQQRRRSVRVKANNAALHALTAATTPDGIVQAFTRLVDNFDDIYAAPESISALRQSILELAVRGKLDDPQSDDRPVENLQDRLAIAAEQSVNGRPVSKGKLLRGIKDDESPFSPPETWQWARFGQLARISSGVTLGRKLDGKETARFPYLRVANVQRWQLDLNKIKEVEIPVDELERYRLRENDILLTEGGDWDKLGRAAIWKGEIDNCLHQNHVFRATLYLDDVRPEWILLFANSPFGRRYFETASKKTTNLASINMTQLRFCPITVPPTSAQDRILATVDRLFSLCDRLEANLRDSESLSEKLTAAAIRQLLAAEPSELTAGDTALPSNKDLYRKRTAIGAYLVWALYQQPTFGRVQLAKLFYLTQSHIGVDLGLDFARMAAGPYTNRIKSIEKRAARRMWFTTEERRRSTRNPAKKGYRYRPGKKIDDGTGAASQLLGDRAAELDRLLTLFRELDTEQAELVATTFAAWNDFLLAGQPPTDAEIIQEVRENWHESKQRFTKSRIEKCLNWLRRKKLKPSGRGRATNSSHNESKGSD